MMIESGPLVAAVVFSAIFLFGCEALIPETIRRHRRKVLSFGAGITIAYVFVHLLPELEAARAALLRTGADKTLPFPALRVYLAALIGFMNFYGLEHLVAWRRKPAGSGTAEGKESRPGRLVHIGSFLLYVCLAGYLSVRSLEEGATPLVLYTVALGLHFLSLEASLFREYGLWYRRKVRYTFVLAPLAGWGFGLFLGFGQAFTAALLGFLSGGIIMNAIVSELPKEKEGRVLYFLLGGAFYTALLVILS